MQVGSEIRCGQRGRPASKPTYATSAPQTDLRDKHVLRVTGQPTRENASTGRRGLVNVWWETCQASESTYATATQYKTAVKDVASKSQGTPRATHAIRKP